MQLPAAGQIFNQRYQLDELLGTGGFSCVFRATDVMGGRVVAIKVLTPHEGQYLPDVESRFNREVQVLSKLRDPHSVTMYDFGRSADGLLFMVFEHVPGGDLSDLLGEMPRIPPDIAVHIIEQVLEALREAHTHSLLHRDIKPENIRVYAYMGDQYRVKLLDFGIAKSADPTVQAITQDGHLIGTPRYMSPEQLTDGRLSPASDIYSLGLVALEMLVGPDILPENRFSSQFDRLVSGYVFSSPELDRLGPRLCRVLGRMTARDPEARYQSAEAALRALRAPADEASQDRLVAPATLPELRVDAAIAQSFSEPTRVDLPIPATATGLERLPGRADVGTPPPFVPPAASSRRPLLAAVGAVICIAIAIPIYQIATADRVVRRPDSAAVHRLSNPVGAGSGVAEASAATLESDARTPEPTAHPGGSPGCGQRPPHTGSGVIERLEGLDRTAWAAHIPTGYDPQKPHSLVVLLHQDGRDGRHILAQTAFGDVADREGFVVIAPTYPGENNLWVWRDPNEVAILRHAVDLTADELCIDPDRVFVVGHGAGGNLVERLVCADWVAGIASNGFRSDRPEFDCSPRKPVPALYMTPTRSKRMLLEGGAACRVSGSPISLSATENKWRALNGCSAKSTQTYAHDGGSCASFECREAPFVSCRVDGGYGWPGSAASEFDISGCDDVPAPPDYPASETLWEFFASLRGPE